MWGRGEGLAAFLCVQAAGPDNDGLALLGKEMPRFIVGDRVRYSTPELGSGTGTIIKFSYVSKIRKLDDPMDDPRVYVLRLEDGSVRRFTSDEIEPE